MLSVGVMSCIFHPKCEQRLLSPNFLLLLDQSDEMRCVPYIFLGATSFTTVVPSALWTVTV